LGKVAGPERRALERALELEPTNRWPSCTAFVTALSDALTRRDPDSATLKIGSLAV
jgi:hypothetical protein